MTDWLDTFNNYFLVQPANTPEMIREAMSLRYQVYCLEHAFDDPELYPEGLEKDDFDEISVHSILRHVASREVAATVRLVLPDASVENGLLPMEQHCYIEPAFCTEIGEFPRWRIAEISRFAVSKQFRRRLGEGETTHGIAGEFDLTRIKDDERRLIPQITLGLFQAIVTMSAERDIVFWVAVMEPQLLRLLRRFGIVFRPVGPVVDYHGKRVPCIGKTSDVMTGIKTSCPDVWEFITRAGRNPLGS